MNITMLGVRVQIFNKHFEQVISVILRVTGLYVLDYWWQMFLPDSVPNTFDWSHMFGFLLSILVMLQGMLMLFLPLEDLVTLYMHYMSYALMLCAELFSRHYVEEEHKTLENAPANTPQPPLFVANLDSNFQFIQKHVSALVLHITIATIIAYFLNIQSHLGKAPLAIYTVPIAARLAKFPTEHLSTLHNCATAIAILTVVYYVLELVPGLIKQCYKAWNQVISMISELGFMNTILTAWSQHYMASQCVIFWFTLFASQIYNDFYSRLNDPASTEEWYVTILFASAEICSSPISLIATCVTVSWLSSSILHITTCYVQGELQTVGNQAVRGVDLLNAGMGEGITFAILAAQTGLIKLQMPQRLGVMSIIMFIVIGSLIQSMYETAEPVLLALAASHNRSVSKHARALSLITLLLVAPLYMAAVLYKVFDTDFWTLVVMSTCALTSVQVLGTLVVYGLFAYDALYLDSQECWDGLDDVVYCARAFTRCLEFAVAVFVVAAGIRESIRGDFSWLNAIVLFVHCYCNVWHRLQMGWQAFLLRRDAVRKVASLPEATATELQLYDDVCSICYMEMVRSARRTSCKHFFHAACLRKWLYIQDKCPLCSARICQTKAFIDTIDLRDLQRTDQIIRENFYVLQDSSENQGPSVVQQNSESS